SAGVPTFFPRPPVVGFVLRRDREGRDIVQRLKRELTLQENQVVALWGAGGVGKTTLAAEAVRALSAEYERVVWIDADGRADFTFSSFIDEFANQLNLQDMVRLGIDSKVAKLKFLVGFSPILVGVDYFEDIPTQGGG